MPDCGFGTEESAVWLIDKEEHTWAAASAAAQVCQKESDRAIIAGGFLRWRMRR
jgi:hypothetical protein